MALFGSLNEISLIDVASWDVSKLVPVPGETFLGTNCNCWLGMLLVMVLEWTNGIGIDTDGGVSDSVSVEHDDGVCAKDGGVSDVVDDFIISVSM